MFKGRNFIIKPIQYYFINITKLSYRLLRNILIQYWVVLQYWGGINQVPTIKNLVGNWV
jgi:hypothetical protein